MARLDNRDYDDDRCHGREVVPHPSAPQSVEEAGIGSIFVVQLVLRVLHTAGELRLELRTGPTWLVFPVIAPALELLKAQASVRSSAAESSAAGRPGIGSRDTVRARAALFLERRHYVGVAPVPACSISATWTPIAR